MYRFAFYLYTLLLFVLPSVQAQEYRALVEQISTEEGLSNRFVRSIHQDSKGFMWFGTKIGLNRYDGYNFKVFNKKNTTLQSDHIEQIWEDADSNLWIGHGLNNELSHSFEAIDIININTFQIQSLQEYFGEKLPVSIKNIYRICKREGSTDLYLATKKGTVYIYKGQGTFELFYNQQESVTIEDLWFGERYTWICSNNKVLAINDQKKVIHEQRLEIPLNHRAELFAELDRSTLLISVNDGYRMKHILEWHAEEQQLLSKDSLNLFANTAFYAVDLHVGHYPKRGFYLHSDRSNLRLYDAQQKLIYSKNYSANNQELRAVFVDHQGNIWLGVATKGLFKISVAKKRFDTHLKHISTRAIIERRDRNELIIGSYSGRYTVGTNTLAEQYIDTLADNVILNSKFGYYYWVTHTPVLRKTGIESLQQITKYVYKKQEYAQKARETGVALQSTWALHEDSITGRIWIGTDNGLGYLELGADSLRFYKVPDPCEALNTSVIYDFHENEYGLWVASSTGLYLKKANDDTWVSYNKEQVPPYQLSYDYLFDINEDKKGHLWLATRGGGVLRFDPKTGICQQWTTRQGLSHDVTYATLEDEYGYIWISSNKGLMRMDATTHLINTYLKEDGLIHEEFNRKSFYKDSNGRLFFGGLGGVVSFDAADFVDTTATILPIHITKYQYFDGAQGSLKEATASLSKKPAIDLNYDDRFFILELALLDFRVNAHRTYAYQIEGVQDEWIFTKDPTIRVDGLRPGEYQLRLKAELSSGNWSPVLLEIPIIVRQPFYLQTPFVLTILALLLLLCFVYIKTREHRLYQTQLLLEKRVQERTRKIEEQATALRELDEMKSRFFANISHELRTPLTLILGPVEAALNNNQKQDVESVQPLLHLVRRHGLKLKQLIEQILSLSKLEANQLALEERPQVLASILKRLWSNFEEQADLQTVEWFLDQEVPANLQVWMDVDKLEKIINNLLSNALKHTPKGERVGMSTRWDIATRCLYLNVNDTGKGIAAEDLPHIFKRFYQSKQGKAKGGTGIGLALVYELVQLMGGDIQVASILGTGSTFMLTIPFKVINDKDIAFEESLEDFNLPAPSATITSTLLIVEDLLDMRLFLSELLSPYYTIKTAENGQQAFELLEEPNHGIDLVVSDVMMPVLDGFELLAKIKNKPQKEQVPVIMLTARTAERDKLKALRIGVDDYLQKPFSNRELLARIKNLLEHYQQRQDWIKEQEEVQKAILTKKVQQEKEADVLVEVASDPWTENLEEVVKREVGNTQFNMARLAYDLNLSERQLRRKIKAKTGLTPNQYFRCIKLDMARNFLETRRYQTVAEVAHQVGFSNVHYFSKLYLAQYGKKPIAYLRS
ncbi:MAG: ATP-binding protein [Aureispira sp.]